MSGAGSPKKQVAAEDNLLTDLNNIADYVIGNQRPEDCSFNERDTLPDALAHTITYPDSERGVNDSLSKVKVLMDMVAALNKKLVLMKTQIIIKKKKF